MGDLRLVIITGRPGSGKSTLFETLKGRLDAEWAFVDGDAYIGEVWARFGGPDVQWSAIRPNLVPVSSEGVAAAAREGKRVVYAGVVLSPHEVRVLTTAAGLTYPSDAVRLFELRCSETTVVQRRMWIQWDQFPAPRNETERAHKEQVIRDHNRSHTPRGLSGAIEIQTDSIDEAGVMRESLRRLAGSGA
jgi:energy-coupling factor transporter ATP-binding protein EcfA2